MKAPKFNHVVMVNGKSQATFGGYCDAMLYAAKLAKYWPTWKVTVYDTDRQVFLPMWSDERVAFEDGRAAEAAKLAAEAEYNRDLALRVRNGQVGSGMKLR